MEALLEWLLPASLGFDWLKPILILCIACAALCAVCGALGALFSYIMKG